MSNGYLRDLLGRFAGIERYVPIAILLVALATLFLPIGGDRSRFHRGPNHDFKTTKSLAIAENVSAEHSFRLFVRRYPGLDGANQYELYGRFPVTAFWVLKQALNLGGEDLRHRVLAARLLMLALFCGAALLLYDASARLIDNRTIALAATLLAFSSKNMLYWADAVGTETSMSVFSIALGFHGIVVFTLHRRFLQLMVKIGCALLFDWPVLALVLAFAALGGLGGLVGSERAAAPKGWRSRAGQATSCLIRSRYLLIGAFSVVWAAGIVGFNVANEYSALGGDIGQTPSLRSFLQKAYLAEGGGYFKDGWSVFLTTLLHRAGVSVLPALVSWPLASTDATSLNVVLVGIGAGALALCVAGLRRLASRDRARTLPLACLASVGFCWGLLLHRHHGSLSHEFTGVFYFGLAAVLAVLGALELPRFLPARRTVAKAHVLAASMAAVAFVSSAVAMGLAARESAFEDEVFADFQTIRKLLPRDATVFVVATGAPRRYLGARHAMEFFLAGRVWQYSDRVEESYREVQLGEDGSVWHSPPYDGDHGPDFVIARDRFDIPALRTPSNATVFAYDSLGKLADAYRSMPILRQAQVARAKFEIYLARNPAGPVAPRPGLARSGDTRAVGERWRSMRYTHDIAYFKDQCSAADIEARFFLHAVPHTPEDLPARSRPIGFENLDFDFRQHGVRLGGMCVASMRLPGYAIDRIRTGQLTPSGKRAWEAEVEIDDVQRTGTSLGKPSSRRGG